ncbi:NADH-quinone oxidoreductase subunit J [Candidatus Methylomirabilis sp.]|uniref:NADH-quinone oxidoreductase subunit J family protein n=1 Tax=Candidatus Methylomirabilis sp. TaxID=2032687 RepID=UPI002A63A5ED|nr:NADH-quinone oxidoreductase subunit J [Candidatus Methylomirabilis sp.]
MTVTQVVFFFMAAFTVGTSLLVVLARNIVHCAIALVFAFFGVAALFVLLDAEFLAAAQVLLYVGGITILLLFAIMLTSRISASGVKIMNEQVGISAVVALAIIGLMVFANLKGFPDLVPSLTMPDNTASIGRLLLTTYVLPFEVVSLLLLAAMVGAIILARRERGKD